MSIHPQQEAIFQVWAELRTAFDKDATARLRRRRDELIQERMLSLGRTPDVGAYLRAFESAFLQWRNCRQPYSPWALTNA